MGIPLVQKVRVGSYVLSQKLRRRKRYPLVLMLEPLFRCNLACAGCGKIDHPADVLRRNLSVEDCLGAVDEAGAPIVSIAGGEPFLHPDLPEIVRGIVERKRFVYLCTNAVLLERNFSNYEPSPYLTFSVHLDGLREEHDEAVSKEGVFEIATEAIRAALARGFRVTINCTLFDNATAERVAAFMDYAMELGVEGVTMSPGFQYERAPNQDIYIGRQRSKELFRRLLDMRRKKEWRFNHSSLFLDFLAGNQSYECTPWGNPTRTVFGWQKPCYLLVGDGYADTFAELMSETDWDAYGVGKNERCSSCRMHCGFEPTAVDDTFSRPWRAMATALRGPRTSGEFAPDPANDLLPRGAAGEPSEPEAQPSERPLEPSA